MDDVVAAPLAEEMAQDTEPEAKGGPDPPPAVDVELGPWPGRHDADARNARIVAVVPLPERQVRDLVPLRGQALRERPVPALGAADRVRVETVVDEADMHVLEGNCEV